MEFCKSLPKIELHAHLNGSLSNETLKLLNAQTELFEKGICSLNEVFDKFKIAHAVTTTKENVYIATKSVIEEFFKDNVIYLELRTTPRSEIGMSRKEYIESVIKAIKDNTNEIIVKVLLSIDRRHDRELSENTLLDIIEMKEKYPDIIKGIDLSGDPHKGIFNKNLFIRAREAGLFVSLHCAEVKNDDEVKNMLNFHPNRLGHCTVLHPSSGGTQENWDLYKQLKIPAEFCLTSNVICQTANNYEEHHVKEWMDNILPFSLNTDDKGVFCTSLSEEYFHAYKNFGLNEHILWNISYSSIDQSFASDGEKTTLKSKLEQWKKENMDSK